MIYYKKLNYDKTINVIGTQDSLPKDAVEITEEKYKYLNEYIKENAVHDYIEFSQLNLEECENIE